MSVLGLDTSFKSDVDRLNALLPSQCGVSAAVVELHRDTTTNSSANTDSTETLTPGDPPAGQVCDPEPFKKAIKATVELMGTLKEIKKAIEDGIATIDAKLIELNKELVGDGKNNPGIDAKIADAIKAQSRYKVGSAKYEEYRELLATLQAEAAAIKLKISKVWAQSLEKQAELAEVKQQIDDAQADLTFNNAALALCIAANKK